MTEAQTAYYQAAPDPRTYIGSVIAIEHDAFGPSSLDVFVDGTRTAIGPYLLPRKQAAVLWHLLGVALGVLSESRTDLAPELARNADGLAHGVPWEGETLP